MHVCIFISALKLPQRSCFSRAHKNLIMDKYTTPKMPTTQHILEDIYDPEIVEANNFPAKLHDEDEELTNGYLCFKNFKQLEEDLNRQCDLNAKLNELNKKLVDNIANMKK